MSSTTSMSSIDLATKNLLDADAVLEKKAHEFARLKCVIDEATKYMHGVTEMVKKGEVPEDDIFPFRFVDRMEASASQDVEDWLEALSKRKRAHKELLCATEADESAKKKAKKESA